MDDERLQRVLGREDLSALRTRLRAAYEREPAGATPPTFRLARLAPHEREALAALSGRPPREVASMQIDPAALGARLAAAGIANDLREALERLDGPIRPLAAERAEQAAAWAALVQSEAHPALGEWLRLPNSRGLLKRLASGDADAAARLLDRVRVVLQALPAAGTPRARLGAETLGDAHALDDGQAAATLALAVVRHARSPETDDDEGRRALWATVGVSVNELARPALALNLQARDGEPAFWSLRQLLRTPLRWPVQGLVVNVCENPNLVAIAADALGARCAPLVCTDGMPAAAQRALLSQLAASGARLRYHGDFDWPGIAIANFVQRAFGAKPWRMAANDYERGLGLHAQIAAPLNGTPVTPAWSDALGATMQHAQRALAEEALAAALLEDLALP
ncbi:MAG: TIGR02679 family protein [Burkholderiales bacterium]